MKGCFVFPHKEMKKTNKGFYFFYGSLCWASPVSSCPAQTDFLGTGIHPWGRKTFFSLGRGSFCLLVAFRSVLPSLFSLQTKGVSIPGVLGSPCTQPGHGFDPRGSPFPLSTPQIPAQPPELLLVCLKPQEGCAGLHQGRREQSGFVLIRE